jgi:hypothetical protein
MPNIVSQAIRGFGGLVTLFYLSKSSYRCVSFPFLGQCSSGTVLSNNLSADR